MTTTQYDLWFDFDCEYDAPGVLISDSTGAVVIAVFEEPTCTAPEWSSNSDDWKPGPLALRMLDLLNGATPA